MFIDTAFALQEDRRKIENRFESNQNNRTAQGIHPEERWREEIALHLHMKNRKKFTHLYQLEKYFR